MPDILPVSSSSKKGQGLLYLGAIVGTIIFFFSGQTPLAVVGYFTILLVLTAVVPFLNLFVPVAIGGMLTTALWYILWLLNNGSFAGSL